MPLPLLLAVTPLPSEAFVPFVPPPSPQDGAMTGELVETFDSQGRAAALARDLPRTWSGDYRPYGAGASMPVELRLETLTPMGQMVDLRGRLMIGDVETPVQGNLNAKSDQLDLLLLADTLPSGMEAGGTVMGLQGFGLSAWQPPRLSSLGGRLQMVPRSLPPQPQPSGGGRAPSVRGLW